MIDLATTTRQSLTIPETQAVLGKSRRTIYYWIELDKLPIERTPLGPRVRIDVVRALAQHLSRHVALRRPVILRPRTTSCAKAS